VKTIHLAAALGLGVCTVMTSVGSAEAANPAPASKSITPIATASQPEAASSKKEPESRLAPNSIYAEGLGAAFAYSLNYERLVIDNLGVRVGFSYLSMGSSAETPEGSMGASATFLSFPITVSYLGVRSGKHALELGGGATLIHASGSASGFGMSASGSGMTAVGTAIVGYRIHPIEGGGFNFRVGGMALFGNGLSLSRTDPGKFGVLPWPYVSLGGSF
jgi:hypothetical protein